MSDLSDGGYSDHGSDWWGGKKLLVSLQAAGQTSGGQVQSFIERKSFLLETL